MNPKKILCDVLSGPVKNIYMLLSSSCKNICFGKPRQKRNADLIILDLEGSILERVILPLFMEGSLIEMHPYAFSKDSCNYLKDNIERQA